MIVTGTGTGNFNGNITDLSPNTAYNVRAYATNAAGTEYGAQVSFTTLKNTSDFAITVNNYIFSAEITNTGSDRRFEFCRNYLGFEIGELNNGNTTETIFARHPADGGRIHYGTAERPNQSATYSINFNAGTVTVSHDNTLFIRFRFRNEVGLSTQGTIFGRSYWNGPDYNSDYSRIIYFDFDHSNNRWVARHDYHNFSSANFGVQIDHMYIANTVNYTIVEK